MRNLSTYIEYTLMTRHYAFVPGIGGFLLRDVDASYNNKVFTPSHREVHFNRFLVKDDGMLVNAYMMAEGVSYDEAISQIRIEVASIKSAIEKKKSFELGNLGVLSYDSDHHLVVKNPRHFPLDPDCYGLNSLSIRPWKELEEEKTKKIDIKVNTSDKDTDVISIPKYWMKYAVAVVLIVLCLFANLKFFAGDTIRQSDYASVIDTDILFGNTTPNVNSVNDSEEVWANEVELSSNTVASTETAPVENVSKEVVPVVKSPGKLYYIIIASCTTLKDAERVVRKRESEGYENVGILERDGRFRLYLKTFTDRTEGETFLEQVRVSTPFQSAWLLPVAQESLLSYYLKNIDNDQLPMELSHPYQRTERDQGWINT